jgi:membrane-anchored protein YejM (alkaline phosphatase superfamily)
MSSSLIDEVFRANNRPNIVMVTVDSCRFDSAARARTPTLDALGPLRRAITPGSFTLPSHMAIFSGYMPNVVELPHLDYYSREKRQLWRLDRAKKKDRETYRMLLQGDALWEGLGRAGYKTIGAGGVRWFLTKTLTEPFDEFVFRGPHDYSDWFAQRTDDDFVLTHPEELVAHVPASRPWFLFVNALETHAPYNSEEDELSNEARAVIKKAAPIWAGRIASDLDVHVAPEEYRILHKLQISAMETVDRRLARLFDMLPKPFLVVACADHGESFGEEGKWGHGFPSATVMNVPMWVGAVA